MVFGFIAGALFGGKKSRTETVSETTIVNESVFNALSETVNASSAKVLTNQRLSMSGVDAYCRLEVLQSTNVDVKVMQKFDEKTTQDLLNKVMNDLDKKAKQAVEQKTGWFSMGSSKAENVDKTMTNIRNTVKKNITARLVNRLAGEVATNQGVKMQNLKLDPYGIGIYEKIKVPPPLEALELLPKAPPCKIDQDLQVRYVSEQMGSKIMEIINKDTSAAQLAQDIEQDTIQESQGVGGAIKEALDGLTGPYMASLAGSCILCCMMLIAMMAAGAGGGPRKKTNFRKT